MVMGEDTVGACGEAFAQSDGVCVCVCVCVCVFSFNYIHGVQKPEYSILGGPDCGVRTALWGQNPGPHNIKFEG